MKWVKISLSLSSIEHDVDDRKESDYLKRSLLDRRFKRVKYLIEGGKFKVRESDHYETCLPVTSVECVEYFMKNFGFEKQVKTVSFVQNVILSDNYPLFKYVIGLFPIDSLEPYYDALNQTNSESIRNYVKTNYSSILNSDKFIPIERVPVRLGL